MIIAILTVFCSILGLIGFFVSIKLFYIFGVLSLLSMIMYGVLMEINKNKIEIEKIRYNGFYRRTKNRELSIARTKEEKEKLVKQFLFGSILSNVSSFIIICGVLLFLFSYKIFIWAGIIGGFGYLVSIFKIFRIKKIKNKI